MGGNIMTFNGLMENMKYLFKNADYILTEDDYMSLNQKYSRAKRLEKNNGVIFSGLTQSAVFWLNKAYISQEPVNKKAFDDAIEQLSQVHQSNTYS